jgi:hypothetical protein
MAYDFVAVNGVRNWLVLRISELFEIVAQYGGLLPFWIKPVLHISESDSEKK